MTVEVLVLGWSDIVRRRVLPALTSLPAVQVSVATTSAAPTGDDPTGDTRLHRTWHGPDAVDQALDACADAVVYVSGVNTVHARRVEAALSAGHHVIVDKPGFLSMSDADRCLRLAEEHHLLLAEAVVWPWHDQVVSLLATLRTLGRPVQRMRSTFVIPALPPANFRTDPARGGGAVADMGAYALSPGRVFGGGDLMACQARITERSAVGLDIGFQLTGEYRSGLTVEGTFSMNGAYANRLEIEGDGFAATLSPAFSSRPDDRIPVQVVVDGEDLSFTAAATDPFAQFLAAALTDGLADPDQWTTLTRASASDLTRLAHSCGLSWG